MLYNAHLKERRCAFFMIRKDYPKFEILQSKNPEELTEKLNMLMEKIACKSPEVKTDYDSSIGHFAHVRWQEEIIEPEDIRDEYKLKGIEYVCGQCPFFVLQKDRRIKYSVCNQGTETWYDHKACVELYQMIEDGKVEI